jgi:hypothetical protein
MLTNKGNTNQNYTEIPSQLSQIIHHQENKQQLLMRILRKMNFHTLFIIIILSFLHLLTCEHVPPCWSMIFLKRKHER